MAKSIQVRNNDIASELNAIIQGFLYEKFGEAATFQVQYNLENIHIWVQVDGTKFTEEVE